MAVIDRKATSENAQRVTLPSPRPGLHACAPAGSPRRANRANEKAGRQRLQEWSRRRVVQRCAPVARCVLCRIEEAGLCNPLDGLRLFWRDKFGARDVQAHHRAAAAASHVLSGRAVEHAGTREARGAARCVRVTPCGHATHALWPHARARPTHAPRTALLAAGRVKSSTLVWEEGAPAWTPLAQALGTGAAPPHDADAQLRSFQAALSSLEEAPAVPERPGTPECVVLRAAVACAAHQSASSLACRDKSFVDDDGTAYTWDASRRAFVLGERAAQPSYGAEEMTFPDEEAPPAPPPRSRANHSRHAADQAEQEAVADELEAEAAAGGAGRRRVPEEAVERERARVAAKKEERASKQPQHKVRGAGDCRAQRSQHAVPFQANTSVYVSGLPEDATQQELALVFEKCGLIREGEDGAPRVRLYCDASTGLAKGDGLVTYLKEASVHLACTILDGAPFRAAQQGRQGPMTVTPATFRPKPAPAKGGGGQGTAQGDAGAVAVAAPAAKRRKAGPGARAPDKALAWDGFDDTFDAKRVVVVLRGLFDSAQLLSGGTGAVKELKAEVEAECASFGPLETARVYEHHPEGVVSVKFREPDAAAACLQRMHGRWFGGRQLSAQLYDGRADLDFHRPRGKAQESTEEQQARLERFARELEQQEE